MEEAFIDFISNYGYWAIFFSAVIDELPFGGIIVPDEVVFATAGLFAKQGILSFPIIFIVAATPQILGQFVMYKVGQRYGESTLDFMRVSEGTKKKVREVLKLSDTFMAIILRLTSTFSSIVALTCGMHQLNMRKFLTIEIIMAIGKTLTYTGIGYFIASTIEESESIISQLGILVVVVVLISVSISLYTNRRIVTYTPSHGATKSTHKDTH